MKEHYFTCTIKKDKITGDKIMLSSTGDVMIYRFGKPTLIYDSISQLVDTLEQFNIMKENEINQKLLEDAENEFYLNIMRVFNRFKHENLTDEVAASLTTTFYNDPVYTRIRDKIKSGSEDTFDHLRGDKTNGELHS